MSSTNEFKRIGPGVWEGRNDPYVRVFEITAAAFTTEAEPYAFGMVHGSPDPDEGYALYAEVKSSEKTPGKDVLAKCKKVIAENKKQ